MTRSKPFLVSFMSLAFLSALVSLVVHGAAVVGSKWDLGGVLFVVLHLLVFVTFVPAGLAGNKEVKEARRGDWWDTATQGCPRWMKVLLHGCFLYALVNFVVFWIQMLGKDTTGMTVGNAPPEALRGFSGHWMMFHWAAFVILYSRYRRISRVTPEGKEVNSQDRFARLEWLMRRLDAAHAKRRNAEFNRSESPSLPPITDPENPQSDEEKEIVEQLTNPALVDDLRAFIERLGAPPGMNRAASHFYEALLKVDNLNLDVLGVRFAPPNPSELLASAQMRDLLQEVCSRYDRVILDTPATLGLPDSKIVSELCDGLVMVVRADVTPREDVQAALEVLDQQRLLGLVLNGVDTSRERYGYY